MNLTYGLISSVNFKRLVIVEKPKKSEWLKKEKKIGKLKRNQSLTLWVAASSSFVSVFLSIFFNLQILMGFVEDPTYALSLYNHHPYMFTHD